MAAVESTRLRLAAARRPRRSHAERRAETRAKIIDGVVESIADIGLAATTATEIARRSGATWGAVQHHFGDKDGLMSAVLEESFNRFAERIDAIPVAGTDLEQRSRLFVNAAWQHFSSRHYQPTFEILVVHMRRKPVQGGDGEQSQSWQERMTRAWDAVWTRVFADAPIPRSRSLLLQHYCISVLSGLASTLTLAGETAAGDGKPGGFGLQDRELEMLAATLTRELSG